MLLRLGAKGPTLVTWGSPYETYLNESMSDVELHVINKIATLSQILLYKYLLFLNTILNGKTTTLDLLKLNFSQIQNRRQKSFKCIGNTNFKICKNIIRNRLSIKKP
jgi:hypothetical protein